MARKRSVGLAWRHGPESHRTQVKTVFAPQQQLGAFDHGLAACSDVGEPLQLRLDCSHALQSLTARQPATLLRRVTIRPRRGVELDFKSSE